MSGKDDYMEFYEELQGQGRPTPLDIKPDEQDRDFYDYLSMFHRVSRDRPINAMSAGVFPIPLSAFVSYFQLFEPIESIEDDIDCIMVLDSLYTKHKNEEAKNKPSKPKKK